MDEPEVLDVPSTVPEGEAAPEAVPATKEELPHYDEDKLIKVKGKVKKPVKPDDTERNIQLEKLSAEVKNRGDRIAEIKAIKEARRGRGVNPEAAEHKKKKEGLAAEWNAVLKQKMHIREEFQRANTEREVIKNELREVRSKIPRGSRLDTLEADIQNLDYKIEHESLSATEEKKVHAQLTVMNAARPLVRQAATLEERLKVVEANRASAKSRLDGCDTVLEGIKEKERVASAALDEIRRERDEANVDMPALEVEKQECWEIIQLMRAKMNEVREEFNVRWKEWSEQNKHYNAWRRHDSYRQFQERQVAREQREAERNGDAPSAAAAAATSQSEPYESEIFTIDQLLTYLRRYVAPEEDTTAKEEQKAVEVPKGLKPFKRKDEEDLSFFNAVKKKPVKGQTVKQDKPAPAEVKKKLNHSLEILKTFMTFGVDVPQSTTEIGATIEKVEAKKQDYLERRKRAKEAPSAPETQVLPANGELNGHNEEADEPEVEEEEAEVPAAKEEEAVPAAAVPEVAAPKAAEVEQPAAVEVAKPKEEAVVKEAAKPKEAAKEAVKETPKEAAKEAVKETPKEAAKEAVKEAAKETPKEAAKEAPKEAVKEAVKEAPAAASKGLVVALVTDAATQAVSMKLTIPAGL